MVDPGGTHRTGLEHLLDEVRSLHEHLHRVAVALALSEEMLADALDQMTEPDGPSAAQSHLDANRARAAAAELRDFATRLAAFRP